MAGYSVVEAANLDEVMRKLEQQTVDVIVTALELPPNGSSALLTALRARPELRRIPILALVDSFDPVRISAAQTAGFEDCQAKFDGLLVLESVARLVSPKAVVEATAECVGCAVEVR